MCAIKGIQHPFWGRWFSAQQVFECWGFLHKRRPFWGPLDIHKMGHPTAITCKIITDLDLHFACEATRTRRFFKMKSLTPCSMEEKSSSWSKSTASPSEWRPHWCHSQTKFQKLFWFWLMFQDWEVLGMCATPIFQGHPTACSCQKARCPFCAAHQTPRGTAGPVDEMDSHAQNWCTYGLVTSCKS